MRSKLTSYEASVPTEILTGPIQVGVDVISVSEVGRSLERFGERYVRRVFTPCEAAYCQSAAGSAIAERFAVRFAAKEAVLKALRPDESPIDWRSIEVRRHASGWCDVVLHGEAAALAARRQLATLALSMSHDADCALAVAVAHTGARQPKEG
jgi:holo-[acyl-carrier protein] synthase